MRNKQAEATQYIKDLLSSHDLKIQPGIVLIGQDEPWQVFENDNKCVGIDLNAGVWIGLKGEEWRCIESSCTVSGALQVIEFLVKDQ